MYSLSVRSLMHLSGVSGDLIRLVTRAIQVTTVDFLVPEHGGRRTIGEQRMLIAAKKSKSEKSRHLDGRAVDIVPVGIDWSEDRHGNPNHPDWIALATAMNRSAIDLGIKIKSGFESWGWDRPHWELCK